MAQEESRAVNSSLPPLIGDVAAGLALILTLTINYDKGPHSDRAHR